MTYPSFGSFSSSSSSSDIIVPAKKLRPFNPYEPLAANQAPSSGKTKRERRPLPPEYVRPRAKHTSCGPCRIKKAKCDRREVCGSCRLSGRDCYWEGGAAPSAVDKSGDTPPGEVPESLDDSATLLELSRLRQIVYALAARLGIDPTMPWLSNMPPVPRSLQLPPNNFLPPNYQTSNSRRRKEDASSPVASASPSPTLSAAPSPKGESRSKGGSRSPPNLSVVTDFDFSLTQHQPHSHSGFTPVTGFPAFTYGPHGEISWYDGAMASTKAIWSNTPLTPVDSQNANGPADFLARWTNGNDAPENGKN